MSNIRGAQNTVHFALVNASDGSPVTSGTPSVLVTKDGGTQAAATNPAVHKGNGQWSLALTAAEMDAESVGVLVTESSSVPLHYQLSTISPKGWYVSPAGSDSNHGRTPAQAKLTIGAAISAASSGDAIYLAAGTYSEQIDLDKDGLTLSGEGTDAVTVSDAAGRTITISANNCTVEKLTSEVTTTESSNAAALYCADTYGTTIRNCRLEGLFDGLFALRTVGIKVDNCVISGRYDGANFTYSDRGLVTNTKFTTDSTYAVTDADFRAVVAAGNVADWHVQTQHMRFVNCAFIATRSGTSAASKSTSAFESSGANRFEGCRFFARATNAAYDGNVYALRDLDGVFEAPILADLRGCAVSSETSGTGTALAFYGDHSESKFYVDGSLVLDGAGNSDNIAPTAAEINTAVEAGQLATDLSATKAAAESVDGKLPADTTAKISLIEAMRGTDDANTVTPDNVGIALAASEAADAKSAAETVQGFMPSSGPLTNQTAVQVAVEAGIGARLPAGETEIAAAGSTASNLDEVSGGGGGGTATISPITVDKSRTFFCEGEGYRSRNIVTLKQAASGTVTLAIRPALNDSDINASATHTVTVVGATTLTVSSISTSADGKAIHFSIPADSEIDSTYVVTSGIETRDGQTLATSGRMIID